MNILCLWKKIGFITYLLLVSCHPGKAIIVTEPTELTTTPSESILPPTLPVSDTLETILQFLNNPDAPNNWARSFSPDGQWYLKNTIVGGNVTDNTRFSGFSLITPQVGFKSQFDPSLGEGLLLYSWSLDSSAFIVHSTDKIGAGCPYTRVVIYHVNGDRSLPHFIFEPESIGICVQTTWSSDSTLIAVTIKTDPRSIFIIDKKGQIEKEITLSWPDQSPREIGPLWWVSDYLIYSISYENDEEDTLHELKTINIQNPEQQQVIFSSHNAYFQVIGFDKTSARILVKEVENTNSFKLSVYNLMTNEVEKTIGIQGQVILEAQGLSSFTAMQIETEYLSKEYSLWLFDWQKLELQAHGQITGLVTWLPNEEGFLVVQGDEENGYRFEIVQP